MVIKRNSIMHTKTFVLCFLICWMCNLYGQEHQETKESVPQSDVSKDTDRYARLFSDNNGRIPISRGRYLTGGIAASLGPVLRLLGYYSKNNAVSMTTALLSITGSFGIPRAIQGRYWPEGFYFTLAELVSNGLVISQCAKITRVYAQNLHSHSGTSYSHSDSSSVSVGGGCIASIVLGLGVLIWQITDAWVLPSSKYELVSEKWKLLPTYSYNDMTRSNVWGAVLQYQW